MAVETDSATTHEVDQTADHASAGAGHAATTGAEHSSGLPQFEFQHWAGQIGYLLFLFVVLYILIAKVFAPRIRRVFDERIATIDEALASARAVQADADDQSSAAQKALTEARSKAQQMALEAKTKASAAAAAREAALQAELSAKQAEAETRIRAARDTAMQQLSVVATDAAEAMVEKLTGAKAARETIAAAVKLQG